MRQQRRPSSFLISPRPARAPAHRAKPVVAPAGGGRHRSVAGAAVMVIAVLSVAVMVALPVRARRATAAVLHGVGYNATVMGWTSWYGTYNMGAIGPAWCVDHGIAAPDPALGYRPTDLGVPATTRTALAWLYGALGPQGAQDRVTAAAVMLAGHAMMGARYPHGVLDLDRMGRADLAGFGGAEGAVLGRARALLAAARAHAQLVGPLRLTLTIGGAVGSGFRATAKVTDVRGAPVAGMVVTAGVGLAPGQATTAADGTAAFAVATAGPATVTASAVVPDLGLQAFAPERARAQRVARRATADLTASASVAAPPPPTTAPPPPTTTPPTTTAPPPTTAPPLTVPPTTAPPPPTTAPPPTTTPPTTTPPTTAPTTSSSTTTPSTKPPAKAPPTTAPPLAHVPTPPSPPGQATAAAVAPTAALPRTGPARVATMVRLALGLLVAGLALVLGARPLRPMTRESRRQRPTMRSQGGSGR